MRITNFTKRRRRRKSWNYDEQWKWEEKNWRAWWWKRKFLIILRLTTQVNIVSLQIKNEEFFLPRLLRKCSLTLHGFQIRFFLSQFNSTYKLIWDELLMHSHLISKLWYHVSASILFSYNFLSWKFEIEELFHTCKKFWHWEISRIMQFQSGISALSL